MAWQNVNVEVSLYDDGSPNKAANFKIGPEEFTMSIDRIMDIRNGMAAREMLIAQMLRAMEDNGVGTSLSAMKNYIEGRTWKYWVI